MDEIFESKLLHKQNVIFGAFWDLMPVRIYFKKVYESTCTKVHLGVYYHWIEDKYYMKVYITREYRFKINIWKSLVGTDNW